MQIINISSISYVDWSNVSRKVDVAADLEVLGRPAAGAVRTVLVGALNL